MDESIKKIEKLLEEIDQSSKEFELLKGIDIFLKDLKQTFKLNEEQESIIDGEMTLFLLKQNTIGDLRNNLEQHLNSIEEKGIKHSVIEKVYLYVQRESESAESKEIEIIAKKSGDTFSGLSQSFTAPTAIIPKKTVYADTTTPAAKPLSETIPTSSTSKPAVDPYRLDPNEK
jgi:hypothetical protein